MRIPKVIVVQDGTVRAVQLQRGHPQRRPREDLADDHRGRIAWSHSGVHMWTDWAVSDELYEVGEPFYFRYGTNPSDGCNGGDSSAFLLMPQAARTFCCSARATIRVAYA